MAKCGSHRHAEKSTIAAQIVNGSCVQRKRSLICRAIIAVQQRDLSEVILGEKAIKVHILVEMLRSLTQPPPRHLLLQCHLGARISKDIGIPQRRALNAKIGNTDLELSKPIDVIRYRVTLCGPRHMMSSGDNLDR